MAEALRLLIGGPTHLYAVLYGGRCLLQVLLPCRRDVRWLKWLTLVPLAYVAVVFGTTIGPYLLFWQAAQEMEDATGHTRGRKCAGTCAASASTR